MTRSGPSLSDIRAALDARPIAPSSDYDLNPGGLAALPAERKLRPAAVLVPLVERRHGLDVLLTKRASHLKHHPGQVSFPGGKQEPDDPDLQATALREAQEEIGLDPALAQVLAPLSTHETVTRFTVTPYLAEIDPGFRPVPERGEVDEVFAVPLAHLLDPDNLQIHSRIWQGQRRAYFTIPYGPYYIWGATARMIKGLADRLGPL
ncbi:NUDIX hydrolase [Oceanomicrobium pacificus]|uniref:NUDIX domain-containing protein n=1 Tax=Oceanomicrobium pacificus TaxID=2692916 RepID=A0A6B0TQH0_9RHOB|nr:CoA pyrophosphatase [Oceanomicrobium pacificus]MXU64929.1 NUDIX domain-containing protein [Oceanomicrobium pacificus]